MTDDDCSRTYPANPDTAENPCEDCGRDERKHTEPKMFGCVHCGGSMLDTEGAREQHTRDCAGRDNVIPMRGHTHECPSCHAQIVTERLYEGHTDTCRQPEIRMRRAEATIAQLQDIVHQLVGSNNESVSNIIDLNTRLEKLDKYCGQLHAEFCAPVGATLERHDERLVALEKDHGKPQDIEPDTKRSGGTTGLGYDWAPPVSRDDGLSERSTQAIWAGPFPHAPGFTHPDAEPAESPSEAPAGAEPSPGGPERSR